MTILAILRDVIKPVFKDLTHPKLLGRSLGVKTQNNNESLNSLIWKSCPKILITGRRIAEIAKSEAVMLFNDGNTGRLKVMEQFVLSAGYHAQKILTLLYKERVTADELRFSHNTKEMRMAKRRNLKGILENFLLREG